MLEKTHTKSVSWVDHASVYTKLTYEAQYFVSTVSLIIQHPPPERDDKWHTHDNSAKVK